MIVPNPHRSRAIGQKIELVPFFVTKILYCEGEGPYPARGQSVLACYSCYTADGKQILKRKNTLKRLPVGSGRLIEALEITLKSVRAFQKFTLIVSPQYAYKKLGPKTGVLPTNEKLIFEFQILGFEQGSHYEDRHTQIIALNEALEMEKQFKAELKARNYDKALKVLWLICKMLIRMKANKCHAGAYYFTKYLHLLIITKHYRAAFEAHALHVKNFGVDNRVELLYIYALSCGGYKKQALDYLRSILGNFKESKQLKLAVSLISSLEQKRN